jgi:hypothetical protein
MNTNFGPVLEGLLSHLQATTVLPFTANASAASAVLTGVSDFSGLFEGLPLFGPAVPNGATIQSIDAGEGTMTLSLPVSAAASGAQFSAGFQTWSRRLQHWTQVSAQPAGFLRRVGTTDAYDPESVWSITTLECEIWIYCDAGKDPAAAPDDALNYLEQLVRQSFAPDDDQRFTLGGQFYWGRFEGRGDASPGDQGGQAISRMPVRITLP